MQRETPRDDLRALSKVLAKKTQPIDASPQVTENRRHSRSAIQDVDDSPALDRAPRLSMPLNDLDDDSFHEAPPRLSYPFEDDDELEGGRRALLNARLRRAQGSFGEPSLGDLNDIGMDNLDGDEDDDLRNRDMTEYGLMDDDLDDLEAEYVYSLILCGSLLTLRSGETGELRALMESRRRSGASGLFDDGGSPETEGEPTFVFRIPERRRDTLPQPILQANDALQEEADLGAEADYGDDWSDVAEEEAMRPLRTESVPLVDIESRPKAKMRAARVRKELKVSRFGIEYPSMPPAVIKRLASTFSRTYGGSGKLNKETVDSISQASDWFFEQISEDLSSYAGHAGRKTIEESDVITLMKR
jgi:histone H3/H4